MSKNFQNARKLAEKRIRFEMHVSALTHYLNESVVPKGLMLSLEPATSELSPSDQARWKNVLTSASLELTSIVLDHYKSEAKSVHQQETNLVPLLTKQESDSLELFELKKRSAIAVMKSKKMSRDKVSPPKHFETPAPVSTSTDITEKSDSTTSNIVNLSSVELTEVEVRTLSRGLSFCPSTGGFGEFQLLKDIDNFARNMRLREFFHEHPNQDSTYSLPSSKHWTPPPQRDKCLDLYIKAVQHDVLEAYKKQTPFRPNLSIKEKEALQNLADRHDIVIKPADKGGAIVIMNRDDYIKEADRQLSDTSFYKVLQSDPTDEFKQIVKENVEALLEAKEIDKNMVRSLIPLSPIAGRFYLLPKIHKANVPGRPIVSGIGTVTENISLYVDSLINKIPPNIPSFIRDTNHFLSEILDLEIPNGCLLVTLDVASLYTNIPHSDGIQAVIHAYSEMRGPKPVENSTLATLLRLILELNNFEFNGKHYVQVSGTSMGTRIGPNYANIFMAVLEEEFLARVDLKPFFYKRFIDDVFLIWPHGESSLVSFIAEFNAVHPNISFSHEFSTTSINFLDVTVSVLQNRLKTTLYRKPTDSHQYLHFQSSHIKHWKTGIPYSQAHRFRRICSKEEDFLSNCEKLKNDLLKQKYPLQLINDSIRRAGELSRNDILTVRKPVDPHPRSNLVLTHSASVPNISSILRKHHNILIQSPRLASIFSEPPRVVYRRNKNLRDILTSSRLSHQSATGCGPCDKPRCRVCPHMTRTKIASSTASGFSVKLKGNFNCDSANVVYLLECNTCHLQYIGQTANAFRKRFNNHRAHAKSLPNLPLSRHVANPGHSFNNLKVTIIESGFHSNHEREVRESYLIFKFKTASSGLNENVGVLTCLPP